ncbi:MAG: hypothetical protein ACSHW7_07115 [Patiriisocius sp.]|uniref:hypothetical protein n=1 Tax=Patiriisocius sp. TaxID=2822396 RepID=UPI003EF6330D
MNLIKRISFYGVGFAIGIVLLMFFLGGKKTGCDYGPNSRTLKNIRIKERKFSEATVSALRANDLDTSAISKLLKNGDVLFSESNTKLDSCKQYVVVGVVSEKNLKLRIENCDSIATVLQAEISKR